MAVKEARQFPRYPVDLQVAVSLKEIGSAGFWAMMLFLAILVVGFAYEWKKGALDWE